MKTILQIDFVRQFNVQRLAVSSVNLVHDLEKDRMWHSSRSLLNVRPNHVVRFFFVKRKGVRQSKVLVENFHLIDFVDV